MSDATNSHNHRRYWRKNVTLVCGLLTIWFMVSLGAGVLFRDWLDANFPSIGHAPFGFWMAQQGSIISFVLLLITYMVMMNRLESEEGYSKKDK